MILEFFKKHKNKTFELEKKLTKKSKSYYENPKLKKKIADRGGKVNSSGLPDPLFSFFLLNQYPAGTGS